MRSLLLCLVACFASEVLCAPQDYDPSDSMFMIASIQLDRKAHHLPFLASDQGLLCAAQNHALDIGARKACSHKGKYGISFMHRAKKCGTILLLGSEIIGCGSPFEIETMRKFKKILYNKGYSKIGCDSFRDYWVCIFGQ